MSHFIKNYWSKSIKTADQEVLRITTDLSRLFWFIFSIAYPEPDLPIGIVGHWPRVHMYLGVHWLICHTAFQIITLFKYTQNILLYNILKNHKGPSTISIRPEVWGLCAINIGLQQFSNCGLWGPLINLA